MFSILLSYFSGGWLVTGKNLCYSESAKQRDAPRLELPTDPTTHITMGVTPAFSRLTERKTNLGLQRLGKNDHRYKLTKVKLNH